MEVEDDFEAPRGEWSLCLSGRQSRGDAQLDQGGLRGHRGPAWARQIGHCCMSAARWGDTPLGLPILPSVFLSSTP